MYGAVVVQEAVGSSGCTGAVTKMHENLKVVEHHKVTLCDYHWSGEIHVVQHILLQEQTLLLQSFAAHSAVERNVFRKIVEVK
jgi:hypothetical protein